MLFRSSKHTKKGIHNVCYKKSLCGKGRYYQDTTIKKGDNACLQGCYNKVRRLLVDGRLVAIDLTNAHIEIIKNLARIMEMEPKSYEILDYYCSNRKQILNDIMLVYDCDREVAKNYFIIILFGGS